MADAKPKIKPAAWIAKVVDDPAAPPAVQLFRGYPGASSEAGHTRLYLDVGLSRWADIPDDAILHSQELAQAEDAFGATWVWVRQDAPVVFGPRVDVAGAEFLGGDLAAAAGGGPGIGFPATALCPRPTWICPPRTSDCPRTLTCPQTILCPGTLACPPQTQICPQTLTCPQTAVCPQTLQCPQTAVCPQTLTCPQTAVCPQTLQCPHTLTCPRTLTCPQTAICPQTLTCPQTAFCPQTLQCPRTQLCPATLVCPQTADCPFEQPGEHFAADAAPEAAAHVAGLRPTIGITCTSLPTQCGPCVTVAQAATQCPPCGLKTFWPPCPTLQPQYSLCPPTCVPWLC